MTWTRLHCLLPLSLLWGCQSCGGGVSGSVDARPLVFPGCPLLPYEELPEPTLSAAVASDVVLNIPDMEAVDGYGAVALFNQNSTLSIFSRTRFSQVNLQGNVLLSVPYAEAALAYGAVASTDRMAVVLLNNDTKLCLMNTDGSVDTASCQVMYETSGALVPSSWNADGLVALTGRAPIVNGPIDAHAQIFDNNLGLIREGALWTATREDTFYASGGGGGGGFASTASTHVVCTEIAHNWFDTSSTNRCNTNGVITFTSSLDPAEVTRRDLLAPELKALDTCKAASSGQRVAMAYTAGCYRSYQGRDCQDYPPFPRPPLQSYITIVDTDGSPLVTSKPTAMPIGRGGVLIWDGTRFVGFTMESKRARVWAFDPNGNFLLENVALHLPIEEPGTELIFETTSVVAVGPNDYVMVYGAYPPSGFETRMVRFSLPSPKSR